METKITLIRHGETVWNRNGRWQGHADIPLNELGRSQAQRLAARLQAEQVPIDGIYTSDLMRALETAQILAASYGLEVHPLFELREMDVGAWSGLSVAEIQARFPEEWRRIHAGEDLPRGGAERLCDLQQRCAVALERLAADHPGQHLIVVTHGGVVRAILEYIQQLHPEIELQLTRIDNTSLTTIAIGENGWRVLVINDTAHNQEQDPAPDMLEPTNGQVL